MMGACNKDCNECNKGYDIEVGRDEDTNDFCLIIHDGKSPACPSDIINAIKEVVKYLEEESSMDNCSGSC